MTADNQQGRLETRDLERILDEIIPLDEFNRSDFFTGTDSSIENLQEKVKSILRESIPKKGILYIERLSNGTYGIRFYNKK